MAWTLFSSLTSPKEPDLDTNLSILANLSLIPCIMTGTNTLTAQPISGSLPPISAYTNNQAFVGRVGNGNTGAATFQYQSLATVNVYKDTASGPAVLVGSEIVQNMMAIFIYDQQLNSGVGGVHFINPIITGSSGGGGGGGGTTTITGASTGAPGFRSNLKVLRVSATTASITARTIGVSDSGQSSFFNLANVALLLNAGTVGAGGLSTDVTGGALTNTKFYYLYAIYAPSTNVPNCLLSISATAPTLPAGYTMFARIGALVTNGSAQLLPTIQYDTKVQYVVDAVTLLTLPIMGNGVTGTYSGSAPTYASLTVADVYVPPTASEITVIGMRNYNNGTAGNVQVAPNSHYGGYFSATANPAPLDFGAGTGNPGNLAVNMVLESTAIYWAGSAAGSAVACQGWVDNL